MTIKEIYELTQRAFETNHVKDLLLGVGEWVVRPDSKVAFSESNDWERIITYGIAPYCSNDNASLCKSQFEKAFSELIAGDLKEVVIAFEYYFYYCYYARSLDKNELFSNFIRNQLAIVIKRSKRDLDKMTEWCGYSYPSGLYNYIQHMDSVIEKKFGMGIL